MNPPGEQQDQAFGKLLVITDYQMVSDDSQLQGSTSITQKEAARLTQKLKQSLTDQESVTVSSVIISNYEIAGCDAQAAVPPDILPQTEHCEKYELENESAPQGGRHVREVLYAVREGCEPRKLFEVLLREAGCAKIIAQLNIGLNIGYSPDTIFTWRGITARFVPGKQISIWYPAKECEIFGINSSMKYLTCAFGGLCVIGSQNDEFVLVNLVEMKLRYVNGFEEEKKKYLEIFNDRLFEMSMW